MTSSHANPFSSSVVPVEDGSDECIRVSPVDTGELKPLREDVPGTLGVMSLMESVGWEATDPAQPDPPRRLRHRESTRRARRRERLGALGEATVLLVVAACLVAGGATYAEHQERVAAAACTASTQDYASAVAALDANVKVGERTVADARDHGRGRDADVKRLSSNVALAKVDRGDWPDSIESCPAGHGGVDRLTSRVRADSDAIFKSVEKVQSHR